MMTHRISLADGTSFVAKPGTTVLQALAPVHRRRIASGCHGGGCGVCRIRIVGGRFVLGRMSRAHISLEDEATNVALACQVWPQSDLTVEPLGKRVANGPSGRDTATPGEVQI